MTTFRPLAEDAFAVITVYSRVLTKSPKVLYQNSSVSECRARRERRDCRKVAWAKRVGKKPTLRGAELATRQSQELAGKNPPPSPALLKKELAKRSLRLMCREDAEGLKAPLTCLRFVPKAEEVLLNASCTACRQDAQDYSTRCLLVTLLVYIYFARRDIGFPRKGKTINRKNGIGCCFFIISKHVY